MSKIIFHIDVNNAFLSWTAVELLKDGKYDIRNSFAVIGGDESARKGIVLAKSNSCKKLGIYTSETLYSAKKKCPALRVYPPNYKLYSEMSSSLFSLLSNYTPDIEIASIDECYLDYTKVKSLYGDELIFANKIKEQIKNELGFTVNIGIANNKLCAKMASDFSKPDKIHTLFENEIVNKMYPLEVNQLFGIGKKTSEKLINLNINTIGDLAFADPIILERYFKNQTTNMINKARGIDDNIVDNKNFIPDSISQEITLLNDTDNKKLLYSHLLALSDKVGVRLRKQNKYVSVICVILKDNYFKRKSHQKKLKNATNSTDDIYNFSKQILDEMGFDQVRLIGIRLDKLVDNVYYQGSLFEKIAIDDSIDQTIDNLKERYGSRVINKASLNKKK